jgi:hypothetical protein
MNLKDNLSPQSARHGKIRSIAGETLVIERSVYMHDVWAISDDPCSKLKRARH